MSGLVSNCEPDLKLSRYEPDGKSPRSKVAVEFSTVQILSFLPTMSVSSTVQEPLVSGQLTSITEEAGLGDIAHSTAVFPAVRSDGVVKVSSDENGVAVKGERVQAQRTFHSYKVAGLNVANGKESEAGGTSNLSFEKLVAPTFLPCNSHLTACGISFHVS